MLNADHHECCVLSVVSGVAGGAASGKTTVCDMIIEQLRDQRVVLVNQVPLSLFLLRVQKYLHIFLKC